MTPAEPSTYVQSQLAETSPAKISALPTTWHSQENLGSLLLRR